MRERFFALDFNLTPNLPFKIEVIPVEGAQGAYCLIYGVARKIPLGLKVEEEVEDLSTFQSGKMLSRIVCRELFDPSEIGLGGTLAKSFELDKAGILLIPLLGSDDVMAVVFLP